MKAFRKQNALNSLVPAVLDEFERAKQAKVRATPVLGGVKPPSNRIDFGSKWPNPCYWGGMLFG